jgi:hypothetical protein
VRAGVVSRLHLCRQSLDPLDRTLCMLSQATALEDLDLGGCFSDCPAAFNEALTALAPLSRLSRLGLEATPVDGSGLQGFCSSVTVRTHPEEVSTQSKGLGFLILRHLLSVPAA